MTTLVLVHGLGCDGGDWEELIQALSERDASLVADVVALDLPGHGRSPTPDRATITELAESVTTALRSHAPSPRSVVLVGHSLGCRVILEAAGHLGDQLAGVIFMDQNLVTQADSDATVNLLRGQLETVGAHAFLSAAFSGMFMANTPQALRQRVLDRVRKLDDRFARELLLDSLSWERQVPDLLSRLNLPVMMLQSTWLDQNFQWHSMTAGIQTPWTRLVRSQVPDSELRIVPGVGHFLMIEAAQQVAAHIEDFVRRVS